MAATVAAIIIWIAVARAKQAGASDQAKKDTELACETEPAIHQVQAENREYAVTVDRLRKGTF